MPHITHLPRRAGRISGGDRQPSRSSRRWSYTSPFPPRPRSYTSRPCSARSGGANGRRLLCELVETPGAADALQDVLAPLGEGPLAAEEEIANGGRHPGGSTRSCLLHARGEV